MNVLRHLESLDAPSPPIVLAAGFFDGVHRGHQAILSAARAAASELGGQTWVLTLDQHPARLLSDTPPPLLTCNKHKLLLLRRYGTDGCLLLPFTRRFAETDARTFLRELFGRVPALGRIVVGDNWRFGRAGEGDTALLREEGARRGIAIDVVRAVTHAGAPVSSTRIRSAVLAGELNAADTMLGRPVSILGAVRRGHGVGHRLGYPTANLVCGNEAVPPKGVYAVHAALRNEIRDGVLNFGTRPTFSEGAPPAVELHLLDCSDDLYGEDIEVFCMARLRDEQRFASEADLCRRIARDVAHAQDILAAKKVKDRLYRHCYDVLQSAPTTREERRKVKRRGTNQGYEPDRQNGD